MSDDWTLFVDESGQFLASPAHGLRVVGGALFQGTPNELGGLIYKGLQPAFTDWPGEKHARILRSAYSVADAFRKHLRTASNRLRGQWAGRESSLKNSLQNINELRLNPTLMTELEKFGRSVLLSAYDHIANKCSPAYLVKAVEHNMDGQTVRYSAMLQACLEGALLVLAAHSTKPVSLSLVVSAGGPQLDDAKFKSILTDTAALFSVRFKQLSIDQERSRLLSAESHSGLVVADFTCYHLGPKSCANIPLDSPARFNADHFNSRAKSQFRAPVFTFSGDQGANIWRQWILTGASNETRACFQSHCHSLRKGEVLAPFEHGKTLIDQLVTQ